MGISDNNNDYIRLADVMAKAFEDALARHNATADDYKSATRQKELLRELIKSISGSNEIPSFMGKIINDAVKEFSRDFKRQFESIAKQIERGYYNRDANYTKYFANSGSSTQTAFKNSNKEKDKHTSGTGAQTLRNQTEKLELLIGIIKNTGQRLTRVQQSIKKSSKALESATDSLALSSTSLESSSSWIESASKVIKRSTAQLGVWQKHLAVNAVELEREAGWSKAINRTVGTTKSSLKQSNDATLNRVTDPEGENAEREKNRDFADYLVERLEKSGLGKSMSNVFKDFLRMKMYQAAAGMSKKHPLLAKGMMVGAAFLDELGPLLLGMLFGKGGSLLDKSLKGAGKLGKGLFKGIGGFLDANGLAYSMYGKGGFIGKLGENLAKAGKFGRGLGLFGGLLGIGSGAYAMATAKDKKDKIFGGLETAGGFAMMIAPFLGPAAPIVMAIGGILSFAKPIYEILYKMFAWLFKDKAGGSGSSNDSAPPGTSTTSVGYSGAGARTGAYSEQEIYNFYKGGGRSAVLNAVANGPKHEAYDKLSGHKNKNTGVYFTISSMEHDVPYALRGTQHLLEKAIDNNSWTGGSFRVTGALGGNAHKFSKKGVSHYSGTKLDLVSTKGRTEADQQALANALRATGMFSEVDVHENAGGGGYHVDVTFAEEAYKEAEKRDKRIIDTAKKAATKTTQQIMNPLSDSLGIAPTSANPYADATNNFACMLVQSGGN